MDVDFLLWLQGIRENSPAFFQAFLSFLGSEAAIAVAMLIPCVTYWCLDKACGTFALLAYGGSSCCNQLIKNTVCSYRPWIKDVRITPDPNAIAGAGGYSFPSGHTQSTASMMVGIGWWYRDRKWPLVLGIIFTLLVGTSRNFLGVHTPQDVIVGIIEGCLFVALATRVYPWIERDGNDVRALLIAIVLMVAFLVFVTVKPYPMDYENGVLLVDPNDMIDGCYKVAGVLLGILAGLVVERRYVNFETGGLDMVETISRLAVGGLVVAAVYVIPGNLSLMLFGEYVGQLVRYTLIFFSLVALAPMTFAPLGRYLAARR